MRVLSDVISEMVSEIKDNKQFVFSLENIKKQSYYKAPEDLILWEKVSMQLQFYIHTPKHDWEFKILSIFTKKPIEEIKLML